MRGGQNGRRRPWVVEGRWGRRWEEVVVVAQPQGDERGEVEAEVEVRRPHRLDALAVAAEEEPQKEPRERLVDGLEAEVGEGEGARMERTVEQQSLDGRSEMQVEEALVSVWTSVVQGVVKVSLVLPQVGERWLSRSLLTDQQSP